ncbi:MAG: DUF2911 domain-containing protein [Saprospiraceae bacterium]
MKRFTLVCLIAIIGTTFLVSEAQAQKFSKLDKSPMDAISFPKRSRNKVAKVYYSRPQLKGRALSKLLKNGKVWRTGANQATEITFYKDVKIGGQALKAGTYTLFTVPGENEWELIINSSLHQWGAFQYKKKNDVLRAKGKVETGKKSIEAFSMAFDKNKTGVDLVMAWDKMIVRFAIEF